MNVQYGKFQNSRRCNFLRYMIVQMLALEAIYGDNLDTFGEKSAPRSFQVLSVFYIYFLEEFIFVLICSRLPGHSNYKKNVIIVFSAFNSLQIHVHCEI